MFDLNRLTLGNDFNPQEQVTTVEEHGKELNRDHMGQFLLFAVSFLGIF